MNVDMSSEFIQLASKEGIVSKGFGKGYKTAFSYSDEIIGLIDVSIE